MIDMRASRPRRLAGGGPLQRRVRHHFGGRGAQPSVPGGLVLRYRSKRQPGAALGKLNEYRFSFNRGLLPVKFISLNERWLKGLIPCTLVRPKRGDGFSKFAWVRERGCLGSYQVSRDERFELLRSSGARPLMQFV
jgi:hypothetical protein